jgi:hypothetical protein
MRARTLLFLATSVAFLAVLWSIFRTHTTTTDLAARLIVAQHTRDRLGTELQHARKTVLQPPASTKSEAAPVPKVPADAKPGTPGRPQRPLSLMDLRHDNPQLSNLWIAAQRSQLQQRYGVLFQTLNLTPVQRDNFKDIIAAKVARETDISAAATAQGLEFNDPVIKKLVDDSQKQMETELLAELGEKNFQAYQEFDRTTSVRGFVGGFAVQMAMTEPLTPTQADQLAKALIAATPAAENSRNLDATKVNWTMVDRAAEQLLSPTQFAAWKLGVAQQNMGGGSRLDQELKKAYETAKANTQKYPGS